MLWILLLVLLLAAIGVVLWQRSMQEAEWRRELEYLSRHDQPAPEPSPDLKPAKPVYGAEPNLKNTRQEHRAAEEIKAVYEHTVEKLRALSPRHSKKLDAISGRNRPQADVSDLPIFAHTAEEEFQEVVETTPLKQLKAEPLSSVEPEVEKEFATFSMPAEPSEESFISNNIVEPQTSAIPMFTSNVSTPKAERETAEAVAQTQVQASAEPAFRRHRAKPIAPAAYVDYGDNEYRTAKPVNSDLPVITLEEATRTLNETSLAELNQEKQPISSMNEQQAFRAPAKDLEVIEIDWKFKPSYEVKKEAGAVQTASKPLQVIDFDDPAVVRTRSRTLAEMQKLKPTANHTAHTVASSTQPAQASAQPQIIGEDDIRSNLLRQRLARRRQVSAQAPQTDFVPHVIPEGEVMANLSHTDSPAARHKIRRMSTAIHESVIPEAARVEQSHASRVVQHAAVATKAQAPLYSRFTPFTEAVSNRLADSAASEPMIVEPPPVPETDPQVIDIAEPPAFPYDADERYGRSGIVDITDHAANAHISDAPRWSIHDRLVSESPTVELSDASYESMPTDSNGNTETTAVFTNDAAVSAPASSFRPSESINTSNSAAALPVSAHESYPLPDLNLLLPPQFDSSAAQTEEALLENSITIEEKLAEFKVKVKVMDAYAGPVITRYEIEPDVGVRGNAVLNLEKDLARSLGVASIRVVETIPGKTYMGLELPNPKRQMIRLSEIFDAPAFRESKSKLTLALGQDITGEPVVTDLAKAPHLLVAGTTGSGKSVGVNAMILSMLFKATPEDVRMIMIDPKMLELSIYEGIPHLLAPVVTDMKLAANALNWCVNEMEKRYRLMSHMGVRNISGFNQKVMDAAARGEKLANPFSLTPDNPEPLEKLPFIVVVVDEFADLMMTAGKKIEELIARLAQKARAAGIHLILATQRPSVDVITGLIKANIPTRIAFQVSSKVDSRTILDQMGAENLLGKGDMLFLPPGTGYPQRVHGAFAEDDEVHGVVEYLKQFGEPDYVDDILTSGVDSDDMFSNANSSRNNDGDQDPMYDEAVACVIKTRKASISSIQRFLRIGYNRAARLVDQMEADGIVSAPESNGNRTVLAPPNNERLDD